MIKKRSAVFLIFITLCLLLPLVNAQVFFTSPGQFIRDAIQGITSVFEPVFQALFGDYTTDEFLFAKVLLLILLFVVIYAAAQRVEFLKNNKSVTYIVALIISIMAVRFMPEEGLIKGILLPYQTLGIAITVLLPFIIFFYFLHTTNMTGFGRRMGWIFFGIIFLVLWNARANEIGTIANQIYLWTTIALIVVLLFDKNIHYYFGKHEMSMFYRGADQRTIAGLQAEYLNILHVDTADAKRRRKDIERQLRDLNARVP